MPNKPLIQALATHDQIVELHALANATKIPIWWKRLGNTFILQHPPSRVASSGLNVDQKWDAISLFNIAPAESWSQDLLALIPCRTACSSQCDPKTDLMEETRQFTYTHQHPSSHVANQGRREGQHVELTSRHNTPCTWTEGAPAIFANTRTQTWDPRLWYHVELHALANATKSPNWEEGLVFIL
jgi:hypothetical protein